MLHPLVCMCLWKRHYNFPKILAGMASQTRQDFRFVVWVNQFQGAIPELLQFVDRFPTLDVDIITAVRNHGSQSRFWLPIMYPGNPVIFLDDDQIPDPDFVDYMVEAYLADPGAIHATWTRIFDQECYLKSPKGCPGDEVDYCATRGMVLDRRLFDDPRLLKIPDPFKNVEDLWLSYVARTFHGVKLKTVECKLGYIEDGNDQFKQIGASKNDRFGELRRMGWQLLKDQREIPCSTS